LVVVCRRKDIDRMAPASPWLLAAAFVLAAAAVTNAWPNLYDNEFKRWSLSRRSVCKESGGKCYSTNDCCKNYVCAAFDENDSAVEDELENNMSPVMPGWCVHEKELTPCVSNLDCDDVSKCVPLGSQPGGHQYCVPPQDVYGSAGEVNKVLASALEEPSRDSGRSKGGLGAKCENTNQCNRYSSDGQKLCCQEVKMGRARPRKICDVIRGYSRCLKKK
jgi:hypothetical protein